MACDSRTLPPNQSVAPRDSGARSSGGEGSLSGELLWMLSGRADVDASVQELAISSQPFTIGRRPENSLCLANTTVSGRHAELLIIRGELFVRDLHSTNGTLLNGARVEGPVLLHEGDALHFGTAMFTVRKETDAASLQTVRADVAGEALAQLQFDRLFSDPALVPFFQPIVRLESGEHLGYEVLARSRLIGLEQPANMFRIAAERGSEAVLSSFSRRVGLELGGMLQPQMKFFLNTHPVELQSTALFASLEELREAFPEIEVVLEVHEAGATSPSFLRELRTVLTRLKMGLAYDDFGAGQARLMELVEVPPDILKFDMALVRGIATGSPQRRRTLGSLVEIVRNLNVIPLAEGIETADDANACRELGFELAQGYFFGRPSLAQAWIDRLDQPAP